MVGVTKECQPGERKCPTQSYEHPLPPERQPLLSFHFFVLILLLDNLGYQNHYPNIAKGKRTKHCISPKIGLMFSASELMDSSVKHRYQCVTKKKLKIFKQLFNSKNGSTVIATLAIASVVLS